MPAIDVARTHSLFASPGRVAPSDFLRREISSRMQERLDLVKLLPQAVLDAGCGSGDDLIVLRRRYGEAQIIGADFSAAMLTEARRRYTADLPLLQRWFRGLLGAGSKPLLLCEDMANLSLANMSVDLLWSNLALHWHPAPQQVFAEWQRVLRVVGVLMFSCFGPDTLREVRQAFAPIDAQPHTLSFIDMHDLGDMLVAAGFPAPVMDMETITVTYETPQALLADARAFGGNPMMQRRRGLMSRAQGARVLQALEDMRDTNGKIALTFEIIYGHAFKEAPVRTEQGDAIVRFMPRR